MPMVVKVSQKKIEKLVLCIETKKINQSFEEVFVI